MTHLNMCTLPKTVSYSPHAFSSFLYQPFCDGTHVSKAPTIQPLRFTADKDKAVMLCACKQTKGAPYCDGSHLKVIFQDLVKSIKGVFK